MPLLLSHFLSLQLKKTQWNYVTQLNRIVLILKQMLQLIYIFRSMIGEPMNFQHTAHIGSRDVEMPSDQLTALQMQMKSKGGYEATFKVSF